MTIPKDAMGGLGAVMQSVLHECLTKRGMILPMTLVTVGLDGSLFAYRITEQDGTDENDVELIAEHTTGDGFALPLHIIVVDGHSITTIQIKANEMPEPIGNA